MGGRLGVALAASALHTHTCLAAPGAAAPEAQAVTLCFQDGVAYGDVTLAPNGGYKESARECQAACQASPWCHFFTFRQAPPGSVMGSCWKFEKGAVPAKQADTIAGPRLCPNTLPTLPTTAANSSTAQGAPTSPVQGSAGREDGSATEAWLSRPDHLVMVIVPVVLVLLLLVGFCCCVCRPPEEPVVKKKKKMKPAETPHLQQSTMRELVSTGAARSLERTAERMRGADEASVPRSTSSTESQPLLHMPGLTPPTLPQLKLPPISDLGPEPVVGPLEVQFQPLRVPSVSLPMSVGRQSSADGSEPASGTSRAGSFIMTMANSAQPGRYA